MFGNKKQKMNRHVQRFYELFFNKDRFQRTVSLFHCWFNVHRQTDIDKMIHNTILKIINLKCDLRITERNVYPFNYLGYHVPFCMLYKDEVRCLHLMVRDHKNVFKKHTHNNTICLSDCIDNGPMQLPIMCKILLIEIFLYGFMNKKIIHNEFNMYTCIFIISRFYHIVNQLIYSKNVDKKYHKVLSEYCNYMKHCKYILIKRIPHERPIFIEKMLNFEAVIENTSTQ
jgi:hypothetical protein